MSYIGNEPRFTQFPSKFFNGDGSAMTVSLDYAPPNKAAILVFIAGVRQDTDAYTLSGTSLTFTGTVPSGTNNVQVVHLGLTVQVPAPADGTVTNAKLADMAANTVKVRDANSEGVPSDKAVATTEILIGDGTGFTAAALSGDVTMTNAGAVTIATDAVDIDMLSATGTASATTFLRGDNSWQTAGVDTLAALTDCTVSSSDPALDTNPSAVGHLWVNSTSGESYIVTDITTDENVWKNIGDGTGQIAPFITATGGTITTDGDYKVHTFTGDGTFTVTRVGQIGTVESLVIAGGGGAGSNEHGGGGGAGGYRNSYGSETSGGGGSSESALAVTAQAYSITVGGGGTGGAYPPNANGVAGSNSVFSTITSTGGGYGGAYSNVGGVGGSGGGSGGQSGGSVAAGTSNQGYAGGGNNVTNGSGGGGGGAGAVGQTTTSDYTGTGGDGGNGVASSITGASVTRGGGGGGGATTAGAGGTGGGGDNGAGTANTGGGGGGLDGGPASGGNGGSGIVIIRYQFQ